MKRSSFIKLYIFTFAIFLAIDFVWLSVIAQNFYQEQIGFLLSGEPNVSAAALFYLMFVAGLLYFVVTPAIKTNKKLLLRHIAFSGAFFGLVTYGTYELTNFSTIAQWPIQLVVVDLLWGTFLSAMTAVISFLIARRLFR